MIRLKEAFARAKSLGMVRTKTSLALELWPNSTPRTALVNYQNLERGTSSRIVTAMVPLICERLGCSPNYLFGYSNIPSIEEAKAEIIESAEYVVESLKNLK